MITRITLIPEEFSRQPITLAEAGLIKVVAYRYSTGVCALDITNGLCSFTLLPFQGQQIWRIRFDGEDFTMKSIFDEPEDTSVFDLTYGAFLIHCGLTAMGNPSEEDDHPLHGELPNARYNKAWLEIGEYDKGRFIRASGEFVYRNGLETYYVYTPSLRLNEGEELLQARDTIENRRSQPFLFMYMAHINWKPVDGARILYSVKKDSDNIEIFRGDFGEDIEAARAERLDKYTTRLQTDPSIGDLIDGNSQVYDPELCSCARYSADEAGWAHSMQLLPDGRACYVRFNTAYLPNALRWTARTGDEDALGFALPTTGNHLGRAYAVKHKLRKEIAPHSSLVLRYDFGFLQPEEALEKEKLIKRIISE